jgi:hypothetical protein
MGGQLKYIQKAVTVSRQWAIFQLEVWAGVNNFPP